MAIEGLWLTPQSWCWAFGPLENCSVSFFCKLGISALFSIAGGVCHLWQIHSHTEFITAVVSENHGQHFKNCRPQLSKQLKLDSRCLFFFFCFILYQSFLLWFSGLHVRWCRIMRGGGVAIRWSEPQLGVNLTKPSNIRFQLGEKRNGSIENLFPTPMQLS